MPDGAMWKFLLFYMQTRPNEFGSMTERKDNPSPIKSIFCHKREKKPYKTMKCHTRSYKTIKGHTRPQYVPQGHAKSYKSIFIAKIFRYLITFLIDLEQILLFNVFCSNWNDFCSLWNRFFSPTFFVPFVTFFELDYTATTRTTKLLLGLLSRARGQ